MKSDIYESVTNSILQAMEDNTSDRDLWVMPWHRLSTIPTNAITGKPYQGINTLILWASAYNQGFASSKWATFNVWKKANNPVAKGQKATSIVFYEPKIRESKNAEGEVEVTRFAVMKSYYVFNMEQTVNPVSEVPADLTDRITPVEQAENFIRNTGAQIKVEGDNACYYPSTDIIRMPARELFDKTEDPSGAWYSVLLHELTHWTGAKHRLDRIKSTRHSSEDYAIEELVAELGCAFLCARLGISDTPRTDHAQYIKSWIKSLKDDNRIIFKTAAAAQKAVAFLDGLQPQTSSQEKAA